MPVPGACCIRAKVHWILCALIDYVNRSFPCADTTPHQEVFSITPKGFYFRKKVLKLEKALAAFKKNPQGDKGALAQQATGVPYEVRFLLGDRMWRETLHTHDRFVLSWLRDP